MTGGQRNNEDVGLQGCRSGQQKGWTRRWRRGRTEQLVFRDAGLVRPALCYQVPGESGSTGSEQAAQEQGGRECRADGQPRHEKGGGRQLRNGNGQRGKIGKIEMIAAIDKHGGRRCIGRPQYNTGSGALDQGRP